MADSRRVLVTGGAGFVGATLVRRLAGTGYLVRVLDNYSTGDPSYLDGVDAELVEGDIRDGRALDAAFAGMDAVVHLAAAGSVITSVADPVANFDVNVVGTFRVLDAARRAGVERTVQASTGGAVIGDATPPVTERSDHPVEYRPARAGEVGRNFASYDLARQLLGYEPSISREDGIRRTWRWFQESVFGS
jgi:nucleoside-diphosphate-sugar epimerase